MYDYIIIGAGIIGLSIAKVLIEKYPHKRVVVLEKESDVGYHSSGRNSGVLHAGFYYNADSLKAKFTRDGCLWWHEFAQANNLSINKCKKVVIAQGEQDLAGLEELYKRGITNKVDVRLISQDELEEMYPNIKTYKKALFSPNTATINPLEILQFLKKDLSAKGVEFRFDEGYNANLHHNEILTSKKNRLRAHKIINAAGLYADKIAKDFGYAQDYTIIPFKGIYLKYTKDDRPVTTNVYPVPNLKNPFLGVHYTVSVDDTIKIGPTAIPAFWRENYQGLSNFRFDEFMEIVKYELKLFVTNSFGFRDLAYEEMKKYYKPYFINLAAKMLKHIDKSGFTQRSKPGIRAQLLNTRTLELLQDFVVEADEDTVHVLNAVSPAFTSSMPFAKYIVEEYVES
ncbi:MAG: L-2-hydroxyglutarate oxidase [Epsilonproteobacteria bacterium]|nr:L-2-hydroxyglutarate oxidase [Campylobacterota bacterium]